MASTEIEVTDKVITKIKEPSFWKVFLINDDVTPVPFVEDILMNIFNKSAEDADKITQLVHTTGSGLAGIYSFEIAEMKAVESTNSARSNNFPLQIKIEEEVS